MAKLKRTASGTGRPARKGLKTIDCLICHSPVLVDHGTVAAACGTCVAKVMPAPAVRVVNKEPKLTKSGKPRAKRGEGKKYQPSGFPRGWHFKIVYKHTDGRFFSRKKEITKAQAVALAKKHGVKI